MGSTVGSLLRVLPLLVAVFAVAGCASRPRPMALEAAQPERGSAPPAPYAASPGSGPVEEQGSAPIAPGSVRDFAINVGDRIYFDYNQYDLRDDARPVLEAQAAWLVRYPQVRVRIEGNCDERGTREYNFALGARRAAAVKDFLIRRGVDPERITTVSYGKERPIDPDDTQEAWAKNRNAHTAITDGAPAQ